MREQKAAGQILLGCYEGAAYLPAQLASFTAQTLPDWQLLAHDDSAGPQTLQVLQAFAAQHPDRVTIGQGPKKGYVANFMGLLQASSGPWVALSDQDDVWHPDKLARGVGWLLTQDAGRPAMYCSRVWVCGPDLERLHASPEAPRGPGFANALVENIAMGHTIVLNGAARDLAAQTAAATRDVFAHDWWLYLLISGAGGAVHFDPVPSVSYRQHRQNAIGYGRRLRHVRQVLKGAFRDRVGQNIAALETIFDVLTPRNRDLLQGFADLRQTNGGLARVRGLNRLGLYRQSLRGQLGLMGAMGMARV